VQLERASGAPRPIEGKPGDVLHGGHGQTAPRCVDVCVGDV